MKHKSNRVIDLDEVKKRRRWKKRWLQMLVAAAVVTVVGVIGWVAVSQVLEIVQPGDFWSNFSSAS